MRLGCAFVPVRKQGKLPGECVQAVYEKEYGKVSPEEEKAKRKGKERECKVLIRAQPMQNNRMCLRCKRALSSPMLA